MIPGKPKRPMPEGPTRTIERDADKIWPSHVTTHAPRVTPEAAPTTEAPPSPSHRPDHTPGHKP